VKYSRLGGQGGAGVGAARRGGQGGWGCAALDRGGAASWRPGRGGMGTVGGIERMGTEGGIERTIFFIISGSWVIFYPKSH
jgi:hypothetical protein